MIWNYIYIIYKTCTQKEHLKLKSWVTWLWHKFIYVLCILKCQFHVICIMVYIRCIQKNGSRLLACRCWRSRFVTFLETTPWSPKTALTKVDLSASFKGWKWYPIGSMYGIYTYIWLIFMVNVGKYTIHGSYGIEIQAPWNRKGGVFSSSKKHSSNLNNNFPSVELVFPFSSPKKALLLWALFFPRSHPSAMRGRCAQHRQASDTSRLLWNVCCLVIICKKCPSFLRVQLESNTDSPPRNRTIHTMIQE